ncbi:hypothetical protein ACJMK2_032493, partial [Sinanodonta woodiana]
MNYLYFRFESIFYSAFFGYGSGPTYSFYNYGCTGRETHISECFKSIFFVDKNNHGNEIGVSCHR